MGLFIGSFLPYLWLFGIAFIGGMIGWYLRRYASSEERALLSRDAARYRDETINWKSKYENLHKERRLLQKKYEDAISSK